MRLFRKIGTRVEFRNNETPLLADIEVLFERLEFLHKFAVDIILDDKRQPAPRG